MQSFKAIYRVGVMGATLAIVVMGWRLYGPPSAQVKSLVLRAVERLERTLRPEADKRAARPLGQETAPLAASAPPPLFEKAPVLGSDGRQSNLQPANLKAESMPPATGAQVVAPTIGEERLKSQLARLMARDVQDPQLVAWGAGGQLFRCYCRATWGQSPQFSRHFESVAAEPEAAVEQVLAQVDAWRTSERVVR